jgi:hypothetical protein
VTGKCNGVANATLRRRWVRRRVSGAGSEGPVGPIEPVLARLDPLLRTPVRLTDREFADLVDFVRNGLLDPRALPANLKALIPSRVPSGRRTLQFEHM